MIYKQFYRRPRRKQRKFIEKQKEIIKRFDEIMKVYNAYLVKTAKQNFY